MKNPWLQKRKCKLAEEINTLTKIYESHWAADRFDEATQTLKELSVKLVELLMGGCNEKCLAEKI